MRIMARVIALGGVLLAVAPAARAQYPQRREGFWIGFGLGYGSANITCDSCGSGPRTGGVTAFVKLGGTPSRNLLIGGAIHGWSHSSGGATETIRKVTAAPFHYSLAAHRPLFGGGFGFLRYKLETRPAIN